MSELEEPEGAEDVLYDGPLEFTAHGKDSTGWRYIVQGADVVIQITNTAMALEDEYLSTRVAEARRTQGLSEIERLLSWPVLPDMIMLSTDTE